MSSHEKFRYGIIITEWITIIGAVIACFYFLHNDIRAIDARLEQRMTNQEQRSDRLYEMFIDLLKETR